MRARFSGILRASVIGLLTCLPSLLFAQLSVAFVDSLRQAHHIPELAYAVVSPQEVIELQVLGTKRADRQVSAEQDDRFRIGSNTKTITSFIVARLVHEKKIAWDARFFDLFPDMKEKALPVYHDLTLLDLLSFRTRLYKYTYTDAEPRQDAFVGDPAEQRRQFAAWAFAHEPVRITGEVNFSNLSYVAAGLMLEKVSGRSYRELVAALGKELDVHLALGAPNTTDTLQPWGHNAQLRPEPPGDSYKLAWLEAAGNINMSLPDLVKFTQVLMRGMAGRSDLLTQQEFEFMLFGRPQCALGWFWYTDDAGKRVAWHVGNPGTFLSKVYIHADEDRAYILFANVQSDEADAGLDAMYEALRTRFAR